MTLLPIGRTRRLRDESVHRAGRSSHLGAGSAGEVAAGMLALARSCLHTSRVGFAYVGFLDATGTALKGFSQWFAWRARSDRANAVSLVHYLSARGVAYEPPDGYDAEPVKELTDAASQRDAQTSPFIWSVLEASAGAGRGVDGSLVLALVRRLRGLDGGSDGLLHARRLIGPHRVDLLPQVVP